MKAKKVLCLVLALAMVLALAACGGTTATPAAPASQEAPSNAPESTSDAGAEAPAKAEATEGFEFPSDLPKFKIGCLGVFSGSELYIQWKNNLLSLEDKFNVEFQFLDQGGDSATDVENMCIAGVNGILMQGCSESILQITEKYNVPFAAYCMQFSDEEMAAFSQYKTFLGVVTEDDVIGAMDAADAMYNAGCRNVAVAGLTRGYALSQDNRCDAFMHRFTELGGNIIAEDYSLMAFADSISSFAAAYPELDGVFCGFLNEGVFQAFTTEGLVGNAKLASFDFTEACVDFLNNGTMVYTASGQQGTIMAAFAMLYNYLYDGTYIIPDRSQMLVRNWICVYNGQDATDFNEYIRFSSIYSPEEIGQMIVGFNPDYSPEQFKEAQTAYSIADVKARANG
jgi:ABC-type sugar transport system substrate-binding protein